MKATLMTATAVLSMISAAQSQPLPTRSLGACDRTTISAGAACGLAANSDFNLSLGVCENLSSAGDKLNCRDRAARQLAEETRLCVQQAKARESVCDAVGQAPYDPKIIPSEFTTTITNRLFPLKPGSIWVYKNGNSEVTVTVTTRTLDVAGVKCVVVHDVNRVNGKIEEDTLDYYAQHINGNVWYFGEDTVSYKNGIADTEGSWRAGVDGAKPGIIMFALPELNKTNRLEFRLGAAEDMANPIAKGTRVTVPFGAFSNALRTSETTPIEPDLLEHKYYVPGIGIVLSVNIATGEREELVDFTTSP